MNVVCKVIPESEMRPEVNGADWYVDENGDLQVRVTPMSDPRYEKLLMMHEAVEGLMCLEHGIDHKTVDKWDWDYDAAHPTEPDLNAGDDPTCPYRREHCQATAIERILAAEFNVVWSIYDRELETDFPGPTKKATKNNAPPPFEM